LLIETFDTIWSELEIKAATSSLDKILTRRILKDSAFDFHLGIRMPERLRVLLIRVPRENVINPSLLPVSKGFEVRQTVLQEDYGHHATIQLTLNDYNYKDIFSRLAEDVISVSSCESSDKAMIHTFFKRLKMWQHFLERHGTEGLDPEGQRGLYGELRFIQDFFIPEIGIGAIPYGWTGPKKKHRDFQVGGVAIEVKTSIAKQHQKITIANEIQLDDTGLDALYLYYLSLSEHQGAGMTLPELVEKIRRKISEERIIADEFEVLLIEAGYLDEHRDKYESIGYTDRTIHIFNVKEGFPRIISRDLNDGLGDIRYSVSLSACIPFEIMEKHFREEISRCKDE
jgi:hypothetical protein